MNGLLHHFRITLLLYLRNRIALLYGYVFPVFYFAAFQAVYREESPKLIRHMGELLTVGILGGACLSMPAAIVSDRERGIWRRYRFTPVPSGSLVASTLLARYVVVLIAGLFQLVLGMIIGRWTPAHPFDLWVAFTLVSFAFLGMGLLLSMLTDNAPAVQVLGQCIFLPMLIIGGVAVNLSTFPKWALHVSVFLPGRYAVEAIEECVRGGGLGTLGFNLFALLLIGLAGCLAGAKLFRWDPQHHHVSTREKAWIALALAAWAIVGITAEVRHLVAIPR